MTTSFHLAYLSTSYRTRGEAVLTLNTAPTDGLVFWAIQASVYSKSRALLGGVHLGLQAHPDYPGGKAANFGGYTAAGTVLSGSTSPLPSKMNNPNTRNFAWTTRRAYRLTLEIGTNCVKGYIDDVLIRSLTVAGADRLSAFSVWTEDFRPCTGQQADARWDRLREGNIAARKLRTSYYGCANTNSRVDGDGFRQTTKTTRTVPADTVLALP